MAKAVLATALFASLPLTAFSSPMPTSPNIKRQDDALFIQDVNCDWTSVDIPTGWFFCVNSAGENLYCDECNTASSADGTVCYEATNDGNLGKIVACPGDPAPASFPDGKPTELNGFASTFCKFTLPGVLGPITPAVCLTYTLASNGGDVLAANTAGLTGVCDALFLGTCSFLISGAGDPEDPGCVDPPDNPGLCDLAGPGK